MSISGTTTICNGNQTTLYVNGTGYSSFSWSNSDSGDSTQVSPTTSTTYSVIGTSACGTNKDSVLVSVSNLPTVSIAGTTTLCNGDSVLLTASGTDIVSLDWASNSEYFAPTVDAQVKVIATNTCGNVADSVQLTVNALPTVSISGTTTLCNGDSVLLTASGTDIGFDRLANKL